MKTEFAARPDLGLDLWKDFKSIVGGGGNID